MDGGTLENNTHPDFITEDLISETEKNWSQIRAYGFGIGRYRLLAPVGIYCELISVFSLSPLPNTPDHFCGLVPIRGNLVPVYQLQSLLSQPSITPKLALVIGPVENSAAIIIEDKPTPLDFNTLQEELLEPLYLPASLQAHVKQAYSNTQDTAMPWLCIDAPSLFLALAKQTH